MRKPCFHIVEFYNSHHPDPNDPETAEQTDEQFPEGMFRFEKVMGECAKYLRRDGTGEGGPRRGDSMIRPIVRD